MPQGKYHKTSPGQPLYTTPGLNSALGQMKNDLGKCRGHLDSFADHKPWLERSRIKKKIRSLGPVRTSSGVNEK